MEVSTMFSMGASAVIAIDVGAVITSIRGSPSL